jgi:hypothetical protein
MLKTTGSSVPSDKEKKLSESVKALKQENKKLVNLLKDSERLFY